MPRPTRINMGEIKLRRLVEGNHKLREDLSRNRMMVSQASLGLISYCCNTRDPLLPSIWGPSGRGEDPYAPVEDRGCCLIM